MAKHDIVRAGHPLLRALAEPITEEEFGGKSLRDLVRTMIEAMRRAPGVGLAAPQIGVGKRVIVLEDAERLMAALNQEQRLLRARVPFALRVLVNPEIETAADKEPGAVFFEGCLSVPGFSALVPRHLSVTVRARDEKGDPVEWTVSGWPARILQHEVDHLNGTLYVDRMLSRTLGVNDEVAFRWQSMNPADVRAKLGA